MVAPSSIATFTTSAMNSTSERLPSSGENSTSSQYSFACATAARAWPITSSRVVCSLRSMWMSDVAMKVWMRGRSECLTAFQAASMSCADVRARPQITGPSTAFAIAVTASKSPGEVIGKPGLDDVDAQARELVRDLQLLLHVQRDAGRLLAVAQRRVEDVHAIRVLAVGRGGPSVGVIDFPPSPGLRLFLLRCAGLGPRLAYSPRRGRRRRRAGGDAAPSSRGTRAGGRSVGGRLDLTRSPWAVHYAGSSSRGRGQGADHLSMARRSRMSRSAAGLQGPHRRRTAAGPAPRLGRPPANSPARPDPCPVAARPPAPASRAPCASAARRGRSPASSAARVSTSTCE